MLAKVFGQPDDVALFLGRVILGVIFFAHGYQKFFDIGVENVASFFASIGIPAPLFFAWGVSLVELLGGAALVVGVFTRWAALGVAIILVVATLTVKLPVGLIAPPGKGAGYELDLALLGLALIFLLVGPGRLSLEKGVLRREM